MDAPQRGIGKRKILGNNNTMNLEQILSYYKEPELSLTAEVTRQKRYHKRRRINKKWRKRYGFETVYYPAITLQEIGFFNQTKWTVFYKIDMQSHPSTYYDRLNFAVQEPFNAQLLWNSPPAVPEPVEVKTIELKRFGWQQRIPKYRGGKTLLLETIKHGREMLTRTIRRHYENLIVNDELAELADFKASELLNY